MNIQSLVLQASQGDAEAQFRLALAYANGNGVDIDLAQFSHWAHESALQGHPKAMYMLAEAYFKGELIEKDEEKSHQWLTRATEAGAPEAQLAMCQYLAGRSGGDPGILSESRDLLLKAAAQPFPPAQRLLGYCLLKGDIGLPKDPVAAMGWFTKAAKAGDADSQFELGLGYHTGNGHPKSQVMAAWCWHQASLQGHVGATSNLGNIYKDGDGVIKNPERAVALWERAADTGDGIAMLNLAGCYLEGMGKPKDEDEAVRMLDKSFQAGRVEALGMLARVCNQSANGKRRAEAGHWACMAAARGLLQPCEFMAIDGGNRSERHEKVAAASWAFAAATLYRERGSPMHADMLEGMVITNFIRIVLDPVETIRAKEMARQIVDRVRTYRLQ